MFFHFLPPCLLNFKIIIIGILSFIAYSISQDSWSTFNPPDVPSNAEMGANLVYPGSGDFIYIVADTGDGRFWAYSITNNDWTTFDPANSPSRGGGYIVATDNNDFIHLVANGSLAANKNMYRYSIANNTWEDMGNLPIEYTGYNDSGDMIYHPPTKSYYGRTEDSFLYFYRYNVYDTYSPSGDFTSQAINAGSNVDFSTLDFTATIPTNTTLQFQIRSADTEGNLSSAAWYGPTGTGDYYATTSTAINDTHNGFIIRIFHDILQPYGIQISKSEIRNPNFCLIITIFHRFMFFRLFTTKVREQNWKPL